MTETWWELLERDAECNPDHRDRVEMLKELRKTDSAEADRLAQLVAAELQ